LDLGEKWKGEGGNWVKCECFIAMLPCCAVPWLALDDEIGEGVEGECLLWLFLGCYVPGI